MSGALNAYNRRRNGDQVLARETANSRPPFKRNETHEKGAENPGDQSSRRFQIKLVSFRPQIPSEDTLGLQHRFQSITILQKKSPFVRAVMPGQVLGHPCGNWLHPFGIFDNQIGPTYQTRGVGIGHHGADRSPGLPMRLDKGFGPSFRGEGIVFHKGDHRRSGTLHAGSPSPGRRSHVADFDDVDPAEGVELCAIDIRALRRRNNQHNFQLVTDALGPKSTDSLSDSAVGIGSNDDDRHLRNLLNRHAGAPLLFPLTPRH